MHLRCKIADLVGEQRRREVQHRSMLTRMNQNITRIAATLGRRQSEQDGSEEAELPSDAACQLLPCLVTRPKTAHDLWKEWQFGGPGRKPAKDFSYHERGKVKHTYSFRKVVWDKVSELVRAGMTAQVACDSIHKVYGEKCSISNIIRRIKKDKQAGVRRRGLLVPVV